MPKMFDWAKKLAGRSSANKDSNSNHAHDSENRKISQSKENSSSVNRDSSKKCTLEKRHNSDRRSSSERPTGIEKRHYSESRAGRDVSLSPERSPEKSAKLEKKTPSFAKRLGSIRIPRLRRDKKNHEKSKSNVGSEISDATSANTQQSEIQTQHRSNSTTKAMLATSEDFSSSDLYSVLENQTTSNINQKQEDTSHQRKISKSDMSCNLRGQFISEKLYGNVVDEFKNRKSNYKYYDQSPNENIVEKTPENKHSELVNPQNTPEKASHKNSLCKLNKHDDSLSRISSDVEKQSSDKMQDSSVCSTPRKISKSDKSYKSLFCNLNKSDDSLSKLSSDKMQESSCTSTPTRKVSKEDKSKALRQQYILEKLMGDEYSGYDNIDASELKHSRQNSMSNMSTSSPEKIQHCHKRNVSGPGSLHFVPKNAKPIDSTSQDNVHVNKMDVALKKGGQNVNNKDTLSCQAIPNSTNSSILNKENDMISQPSNHEIENTPVHPIQNGEISNNSVKSQIVVSREHNFSLYPKSPTQLSKDSNQPKVTDNFHTMNNSKVTDNLHTMDKLNRAKDELVLKSDSIGDNDEATQLNLSEISSLSTLIDDLNKLNQDLLNDTEELKCHDHLNSDDYDDEISSRSKLDSLPPPIVKSISKTTNEQQNNSTILKTTDIQQNDSSNVKIANIQNGSSAVKTTTIQQDDLSAAKIKTIQESDSSAAKTKTIQESDSSVVKTKTIQQNDSSAVKATTIQQNELSAVKDTTIQKNDSSALKTTNIQNDSFAVKTSSIQQNNLSAVKTTNIQNDSSIVKTSSTQNGHISESEELSSPSSLSNGLPKISESLPLENKSTNKNESLQQKDLDIQPKILDSHLPNLATQLPDSKDTSHETALGNIGQDQITAKETSQNPLSLSENKLDNKSNQYCSVSVEASDSGNKDDKTTHKCFKENQKNNKDESLDVTTTVGIVSRNEENEINGKNEVMPKGVPNISEEEKVKESLPKEESNSTKDNVEMEVVSKSESDIRGEILTIINNSFDDNVDGLPTSESKNSVSAVSVSEKKTNLQDSLPLPKEENSQDSHPIPHSQNNSLSNTALDSRTIPRAMPRHSFSSVRSYLKHVNVQSTSTISLNENSRIKDSASSEDGGSLPSSPSVPRRRKKSHPVPAAAQSLQVLNASTISAAKERSREGSPAELYGRKSSLKAPPRPPIPAVLRKTSAPSLLPDLSLAPPPPPPSESITMKHRLSSTSSLTEVYAAKQEAASISKTASLATPEEKEAVKNTENSIHIGIPEEPKITSSPFSTPLKNHNNNVNSSMVSNRQQVEHDKAQVSNSFDRKSKSSLDSSAHEKLQINENTPSSTQIDSTQNTPYKTQETPLSKEKKDVSLNPFDSDYDSDESKETSQNKSDDKISPSSPEKPQKKNLSLNPFDSDEDENEQEQTPGQKSEQNPAPVQKASESTKPHLPPQGYNPFDEDDDDGIETTEKTVEIQIREKPNMTSTPFSTPLKNHNNSVNSFSSQSSPIVHNKTSSSNPFDENEEDDCIEDMISTSFTRGLAGRQSLAVHSSTPFQRDSVRASLPISRKKKRQAPLPPGFTPPPNITPVPSRNQRMVHGDSCISLYHHTPLRKDTRLTSSNLSLVSSPRRPAPPRPPPPKIKFAS